MIGFTKLPVKVGIIGCSSVAKRRFIPALLESKKAKLQMIGSRDLSKAKIFSKLFNVNSFGSYEEVISSKTIDFVYISTPPSSHEYWLERAIKAKKHVLCEKPVLLSGANKFILDLAKSNGVQFFENYAYIAHPQHAKVKYFIEQNIIGPIMDVSVSYTYPFPLKNDIRFNSKIGGGVINDSLGYPVTLARYLFGNLFEIISSDITYSEELGIDLMCKFEFLINQSIRYRAHVAMGTDYFSGYKIQGQKGSIEVFRAFSVNKDHQAEIKLKTLSTETLIKIEPVNQFQLYLDYCIDRIGDTTQSEEQSILDTRYLMDAIIKMAKINKI